MVRVAAVQAAPVFLDRDATVVCVLTGHGLKDPDTALSQIPAPTAVPADIAAIRSALQL